ncbi:MAG: carboxypeptidase-like regulatory domain-containing protein [Sulfurovum sp.]|nr:carboxypeptidase-like regulatory domain-containing protein [Sulfurovum sp.]MDD3499933.1 carboxypeptidase-like regulatory domain-containing protein [Sulfurovum sp.]
MKKLLYIVLSVIMPLAAIASEGEKGTLSVLLFSDGKPLAKNEIKIDGKRFYRTDKDGAVTLPLSAGRHQLEIFGKSASGQNLGYFKKPIEIKRGRNTEVIATLSKKEADSIDIDIPVSVAASKKRDETAATGVGRLTGTILSSEGNTPVAGARIFVRGTSVDVRSDDKGRFSAVVPSGKTLSISVVHSAYSAQTVGGIVVKKDRVTSRTIKLTPASMELEEFVVLAPKIEGSLADVIQEEKKINAIANIIGSEEFSKKGDSSAASALKRVTGVTLIGGKSIFVRGLGERYSNIELNSLPLPSPDPTKRVVPLNIFPSSMIGSMKVQKSGTADIPANFGGGYIDLRTKNQKEDDYIKIGMSISGNAYTGNEVVSYNGSDTDWLGYDDGYRDIPSEILEHSDVVVGERIGIYSSSALGADRYLQMTKEYAARDFSVFNEALPIGGSFSIEGLKTVEIDDENQLSIFGNYSYSQEHEYQEEHFFNYRYDSESQPVAVISDGYKRIASSEYSHGLMLNIDYAFSDVLNIKYTKLFTHVGEKKTRETEGVFGSDFLYQYYTYLDWDEKTLSADQLSGAFDYQLFDTKNTFNFGLEYAYATLDQPNNLLYQDFRRGENEEEYERLFYEGAQNFMGKKLYSDDDILAFYLNNKIMYGFFSDEDYMQVGLSYSGKERKSEYQKFYLKKNGGHGIDDYSSLPGGDPEYLLDTYVRHIESIDDAPFLVKDLFKPADYFDAEVDEADFYFNIFAKPYDNLEITMGARYVDLTQTIYQYVPNSSTRVIEKEEESLEVNDIYPSLGIKYSYDEKNIVDLAFSRTFIIPDLREFSSGIYFHPYDVATVKGNPELVNTDIYSTDLKYSYFFSDNEFVKLGLFYKYLDKPIEDTQENTSSLPIYSYDNAESATLYGIELDMRKSIGFIGNYITVPYIDNLSKFYVAGNLSFANSDVTLREEQLDTLTSNHRQLQGLSKSVFNATLGYDNDGRSVTLSYNKMGERIRKVGIINEQGVRYGDTYEIPPHLLDFVWIENLNNGFTIKLKVGNILDSEIAWVQDGKKIREYQTGQTFSFGASYKY